MGRVRSRGICYRSIKFCTEGRSIPGTENIYLPAALSNNLFIYGNAKVFFLSSQF